MYQRTVVDVATATGAVVRAFMYFQEGQSAEEMQQCKTFPSGDWLEGPAVLVSDHEPVDEQLKTKPILPGIADPRSERAAVSTSKIGVIGFYYPDRPEPVDKLCNAGFLGNFWNTETFGGRIAVAKNGDGASSAVAFSNSEAAFQALKSEL